MWAPEKLLLYAKYGNMYWALGFLFCVAPLLQKLYRKLSGKLFIFYVTYDHNWVDSPEDFGFFPAIRVLPSLFEQRAMPIVCPEAGHPHIDKFTH